ncbi:hypothetical protein ACVBAX_12965 [Robertmurraya sp. GLU-23]
MVSTIPHQVTSIKVTFTASMATSVPVPLINQYAQPEGPAIINTVYSHCSNLTLSFYFSTSAGLSSLSTSANTRSTLICLVIASSVR